MEKVLDKHPFHSLGGLACECYANVFPSFHSKTADEQKEKSTKAEKKKVNLGGKKLLTKSNWSLQKNRSGSLFEWTGLGPWITIHLLYNKLYITYGFYTALKVGTARACLSNGDQTSSLTYRQN